jgi:hypothetical protein
MQGMARGGVGAIGSSSNAGCRDIESIAAARDHVHIRSVPSGDCTAGRASSKPRPTDRMQEFSQTITVRSPSAASRAPLPGFHLGLAALMTAIVMLGFWPYYAALVTGSGTTHPLLHAHAAIFSGWLVLLLAQTWLVYRRHFRVHRRLGRWGIYYGVGLLLFGVITAFAAPALAVAEGRMTVDQAAGFLVLPIGDILLFAGFFTAGIRARRNVEAHRRLMILAAIALIFPGAARFAGDAGVLPVLALWLSPLAAAMAHDAYTMGRVHRVYWIGLAILVAAISRVALMDAEPWLVIGRRLLAPLLQGPA